MEEVADSFRKLSVDPKLASFLPRKQQDLDEIKESYELIVERT